MRKNKYSVGQQVEFKWYKDGRMYPSRTDVGTISEVINNQYGIEGRTVYKIKFVPHGYKTSTFKGTKLIKEVDCTTVFTEEVYEQDIIRVIKMHARARIKYPSNLKELNKITPEQARTIVEKNMLTLQRSVETIGSLTGLGNIYGEIIEMQPVQFPICSNSGRKAVKSVDEMLKILKAMQVNCQKCSCMILMDTDRNNVNGKATLSIICDDINPNKRYSLHVHCTYDGKYNALYTVGKSIRGR